MTIFTKYYYETKWQLTTENDLLKIIAQEVGDVDPKGTLLYIKSVLKSGKSIKVGSCDFKGEEP